MDPDGHSVSSADLVAGLIPSMARRQTAGFNVFDVMHHGTHERQLSNVFAWLLDAAGTHELGHAFQQMFIHEVNRRLAQPLEIDFDGAAQLAVRQEVNTGTGEERMDIADLVLENAEVALVIENYYTSDGHGHSYDGYLSFGAKNSKRSVVVLLCEHEDPASLTDGWQNAVVVTYAHLVSKLWDHVQGDPDYRQRFPEQCVFFEHLNRRFAGGTVVTNKDSLLGFVEVMCRTGLAGEYGVTKQDSAAVRLADRVREEAIQQYTESRELLQRIKQSLRSYSAAQLRVQINQVLGEERITKVEVPWQGKWQWTIVLGSSRESEKAATYIVFGPSAWAWLEQDATRLTGQPDYTRLFIANSADQLIQSEVSLGEVIEGLAADDNRLRDEVLTVVQTASTGSAATNSPAEDSDSFSDAG